MPTQKDLEEVAQDDPQIMEQLNQIAFYNAMKKENKRFCAHCQKFKVFFVIADFQYIIARENTSLPSMQYMYFKNGSSLPMGG